MNDLKMTIRPVVRQKNDPKMITKSIDCLERHLPILQMMMMMMMMMTMTNLTMIMVHVLNHYLM